MASARSRFRNPLVSGFVLDCFGGFELGKVWVSYKGQLRWDWLLEFWRKGLLGIEEWM